MIVKTIYKTLRSIIFTLTLLVVGIYVVAYTLLSIPAFTNMIKNVACRELSAFLGGRVEISDLDVYPFNEVKISGLEVFDPEGEKCIYVETIGAGISIWKLISERHIVLTYGEIIGLDASLVQPEKDQPLNIDFIIKAFAPKDKNKEKAPFRLALRNVVLRKSRLTFRRPWIEDKKLGDIDLADLSITDLAADISFPEISDKGVSVDLRRLSLAMPGVISLEKIGFKGDFNPNKIDIRDFIVELPSSRIYIPEINIESEEEESLAEVLKSGDNVLKITDSFITPSDFSFIFSPLRFFTEQLPLDILVIGNLGEFSVQRFAFGTPDVLRLSFNGEVAGLSEINAAKGSISDLDLKVSSSVFSRAEQAISVPSPIVKRILQNIGNLELTGDFSADMHDKSVAGNIEIGSALCSMSIEGEFKNPSQRSFAGEGEINIEDFKLKELIPSVDIRSVTANIVAEGSLHNMKPEGMASLVIDNFEFKGKRFDGLSLNISKEGKLIDGDLLIHNAIADVESKFTGDIEGEEKSIRLDLDLQNLNLSEITDLKKYENYLISGSVNIDGEAIGVNELRGALSLNNFSFTSPDRLKSLKLKNLSATADVADSIHSFDLKSDWVDARAEGPYKLNELIPQIKNLVATVFPALIEPDNSEKLFTSDVDFDILIKKNNSVPEFFNLPVRLLVPITISGSVNASSNSANISFDMPYLQQGRDKLIYDTKFVADINGDSGSLNALAEITMPVKRGDLALNINLSAHDNTLATNLHWVNTENADFKGRLVLETDFYKNPLSRYPEINLIIKPSLMHMGTADWNVSHSEISYADNTVKVNGLKIWHDDQFVEVQGVASQEYADVMTVTLADIDVDYIFDMLQINYVTFGGVATGEIAGHALLSGNPVAETESLWIKNFSYNGAVLGECYASSRWNNEEKEIEIAADIDNNHKRLVTASGGIWLGRDSLSFNINADKVPVEFVQPFMAVFSSHVGGYATGAINLYGTFHDIDMTGKIFADSVAIKLDYTNTIYHGSDSVLLYPGRIEIPHFRLYDKFGNSAMLTGELTHRYFHEPAFTFRLSDAHDFLCYDTNSDINPDWYGTLFGNGSAYLTGVPGLTDISADMTVAGNSTFTFVLNDTQYARDYQFLTFSDKKAEEINKNRELTAGDIKEMLRKSMHQDEGALSKFGIDIRATVTPEVLFTLVMDPATGDKINARGRGAMQVKYESDNDEMLMYGKYEIVEGNYNFSLQDIILRDFKIKEGSYITFNGNPLGADLDISATYRVNTNLSDLDKSFSTDRDLNRTNVPVDAVLSVTGNMTSPDITFDIELPTLTQDVERKVKSIISTDDMMNRQIIYLLALNRFYTPEYMGSTGNGGELAAVASSTISSQLSNILGQLTDKFSVSPSFRSDKGDFSDIEVDVALSSKLLNNRLLINGNFGYRDRSNSSTTFVGDFDVEYLLSKNGNLRLKAYNHFNDQNYYLREALTTQGLGIVYRKDFDDWFTFLKKRKK